MRKGSIALENMTFFAHHGYYEEEQKTGNRYSVDVALELDFTEGAIHDKLDFTVNYEQVYKIVAQEMAINARLLEHLAHRISQKLLNNFTAVSCASVSVSKYNPPIGGLCEKAKITITSHRDD